MSGALTAVPPGRRPLRDSTAPAASLYHARQPALHVRWRGRIGERLNQTNHNAIGNATGKDRALGEPVSLSALRVKLLRFATLQLGDPHLAEDAVQEALLGALNNLRSFRGEAALHTWVFSILKNKIADQLRQRARRPEIGETVIGDDLDETISIFDDRGRWHEPNRPVRWAEPESAVIDHQFWRVFEACLENLPRQQARLFMMREFVQLDTEEICQALAIKPGNLNVALHRARLKLRACLEHHWFVAGEAAC